MLRQIEKLNLTDENVTQLISTRFSQNQPIEMSTKLAFYKRQDSWQFLYGVVFESDEQKSSRIEYPNFLFIEKQVANYTISEFIR